MTQNTEYVKYLGELIGYFHQDWEDEFDSWEEVLDKFIENNRNFPEDLKKAVLGLDKLINANFSEEKLDEFFDETDWNYIPTAENETYLAWLKKVLARLENQTGIKSEKINSTPKAITGISGKTSDDRLRRPEARSEVIAALPWVGLIACIVVCIFCLIWVTDLAHEANPNVWPLIATFVGTVLVLAYLPTIPTWVKKTVTFSTLLVAFVMGTYRGLLRIANQAAGGVMHQIGSDASSSPQPQPPYPPSRVTSQGGRPASPRLNAAVEQSCAQRGFEGNWQWKKIDINPSDPEHILTTKGILMPGDRVQICADAETPQDLHKLLVWVGAEPNASSVSTWRPDSKSQKVWYVDKRIQFGFKADAEPGGYLHFLADGDLKNSLKVYVWIGM